MERKSGQAHFPNPEQQSGRICRQHIRLFFLAPYHFYIHELPHFPFFPGRTVPFCTVTCSDSFPVTPHIRYSSPALIFFANLLAGPNRRYRYANRVRIWRQPSANRRFGYSIKSAAALPAFVVRFSSLDCSKIPIPAWESEAARTKGN